MNPDTFDRLSLRFGMPGTRRSALGTVLGIILLRTTLGTTAATGGKHRPKGKRRGKQSGKGEGRVRAQKETKPGNHCQNPAGQDLNQVFDVSDQIVATFCTEVGAGERWTVAQQVWGVAQTCKDVPAGFACAGETPLADFLAKFEGVRYVIDPGTNLEQTVFVPTSNALFVIDVDTGLDIVSPTTLGTLEPRPVGQHVVEAYWVFNAMHCDGLGKDPALQCFTEGETMYHTVAFEVVPGHN
jgi:hypothetical protein